VLPNYPNAVVLLGELHYGSLHAARFLKESDERCRVLLSDVLNNDRTTRLVVGIIKPPSVLEGASIVVEVVDRKLECARCQF
jgi:hypothetical protein